MALRRAKWRPGEHTNLAAVRIRHPGVADSLIRGAGIFQCPTYAVGDDLAAGRLVPILTDYSIPNSAPMPSTRRAAIDRPNSAALSICLPRVSADPPWDR